MAKKVVVPDIDLEQLPTEQLPDDLMTEAMRTTGEDIQGFAIGSARRTETFPVFGMERFFPTIFIKIRSWDLAQSTQIHGPAVRFQARMKKDFDSSEDSAMADDTMEMMLYRCILQICDFCLPILDSETGKFKGRVVRYCSENKGDNAINRKALSTISPEMLDWLQGAMDYMSGAQDAESIKGFTDWLAGLN